MLLEDLNKLDKLKIKAFAETERTTELPLSFEAPVSLDSFSQYYAHQYQVAGGINSGDQEANKAKSKPKELQFNIILDNTCIFNNGLGIKLTEPESIMEQVNLFLETCYKHNSETHSPNFLIVEWGGLKFRCKLLSAQVNYSLFDRGGIPLRAEIEAAFIEDIPKSDAQRDPALSSPDITHSQIVKAGDTLPLIAKKVYGSSRYFLKLAKYNRINHFRELAVGKEVLLPPLDQLEQIN